MAGRLLSGLKAATFLYASQPRTRAANQQAFLGWHSGFGSCQIVQWSTPALLVEHSMWTAWQAAPCCWSNMIVVSIPSLRLPGSLLNALAGWCDWSALLALQCCCFVFYCQALWHCITASTQPTGAAAEQYSLPACWCHEQQCNGRAECGSGTISEHSVSGPFPAAAGVAGQGQGPAAPLRAGAGAGASQYMLPAQPVHSASHSWSICPCTPCVHSVCTVLGRWWSGLQKCVLHLLPAQPLHSSAGSGP